MIIHYRVKLQNSGDSILNSFRAAPNAPTPPQIG
ncbi:hypothetical protein Thiowin_04116 [Thiorhodovibrio winogradskyi]|uniref:Peptidylprolyl isomerase n=1 Tax=Thiorhodovibrio winogradskyi TaxID=77007 RepID=A0ABZ0SES9_9GAMM